MIFLECCQFLPTEGEYLELHIMQKNMKIHVGLIYNIQHFFLNVN